MPRVIMTKRQSERVRSLLLCFLVKAHGKSFVPKELLIQLRVMYDMAVDGMSFSEEEFEVLAFLMELYFSVFEEDDVDPLAEQAYAKITGYWPSDILDGPWYDRVIKYADSVGFKPPKDAREPLGY